MTILFLYVSRYVGVIFLYYLRLYNLLVLYFKTQDTSLGVKIFFTPSLLITKQTKKTKYYNFKKVNSLN